MDIWDKFVISLYPTQSKKGFTVSYFKIHSASTLTAYSEASLIKGWHLYGNTGLVAAFHCAFIPTPKQLARFPKALREVLVVD